MKYLNKIYLFLITALLFVGCNEGIDSISTIPAGTDEAAPVVKIKYPLEGAQIKTPGLVVSINFQFEVSDDIEIGSVKVNLDGKEIASISEFMDYRKLVKELKYDKLNSGNHTLSVTATDLEGKSTTSTVNFEKAPPYISKYTDEVFYMPFENDLMEMLSLDFAKKTGTPSFSDEFLAGKKSYVGATDSYITYPVDKIKADEITATFWYKVNAAPDRAGILSTGSAPDVRTHGFRLFREGDASKQRLKLNVGIGSDESWNDGGEIDVTAGEWVHVAIVISKTKNTIYFNGEEISSSDMTSGIDWTDCKELTIGAGGETFSYWDHKSDLSNIDELRIFKKALSKSEINTIKINDKPYTPKDGELFYLNFQSDNNDVIKGVEATTVGTPTLTEGKTGNAYKGTASSYITFPTEGLLSTEFTSAFWYKVNSTPDRSGIMVVGAPDGDKTENMNNRNYGFRLFREGNANSQTIKLNVGNGSSDSWFDGGAAATIDVTADKWVHIAFTISEGKVILYFNGEVVSEGDFTKVDWTGCDILSIASGTPRFTEWGHKEDASMYDELRIFNKVLTKTEIQSIYNSEK